MKYLCRIIRNNPMRGSLELEETLFTVEADNDQTAKSKANDIAFRYESSSIRMVKKTEVKINNKWVRLKRR